MKKIILLTLILLSLFSEFVYAQNKLKELKGVEEFIEKAIKDWKIPGLAIAVVKNDDVVFSGGFGYRDLNKKLPVTENTLFAIGSCTKAFTTFTLGTLVDEGQIEWDIPVVNYIPSFKLHDPSASKLMTPKDLVTHRSGLPRHDLIWYNNDELSRKELVEKLAFLEPNESFRSKFQYNNLMFLTAGYLIEYLTDKSWEDAVSERILAPLGMERTNCSVFDSQKDPDFALPYREKEKKIERIPFRTIDLMGPAGSINSSVLEMSKWLIVNLNGGKIGDEQIINPITLSEIHSPQMTTGATMERPEISPASYGLGWFVDTYRGHLRVSHGGAIDGFNANVVFFPTDTLGMVILVNKSGSGLPWVLDQYIADILLGLDPTDWYSKALERRNKWQEEEEKAKEKKSYRRKTGTTPSHSLEEYTGSYEHPGYGRISVKLKGDQLQLTYNGITTPLEHWHYEVFNAAEGAKDDAFEDLKFMFLTDMNGNVASIETPFESKVKNIIFNKKPDTKLYNPGYLAQFVGEYYLTDKIWSVTLVGNSLNLIIPGSPVYTLIPDLSGDFVLKEYSVVSIHFVKDDKNKVSGLELIRPDGVYTLKRKQ